MFLRVFTIIELRKYGSNICLINRPQQTNPKIIFIYILMHDVEKEMCQLMYKGQKDISDSFMPPVWLDLYAASTQAIV